MTTCLLPAARKPITRHLLLCAAVGLSLQIGTGCAKGLDSGGVGGYGGEASTAGPGATGAQTTTGPVGSGPSASSGGPAASSGVGGSSSAASSSSAGSVSSSAGSMSSGTGGFGGAGASSSAMASSSSAVASSSSGASASSSSGAGGGGPCAAFDHDFTDCMLGPWTTGLAHPSSQPSSWQCGDPVNVGPAGTDMWGTNLSGNYNNSESSYLMSPVFSLAGCTGNIHLEVTHWYHFYDGASCTPFCDGGIFQISTNGGTTFNSMDAIVNGYTTGLWNIGSTYQPPDGEKGFHNRSGKTTPPIWLLSVWDLSAYAGQTNMRFRFVMGSGGSLQSAKAPGWYIDQAKIVVQ